MCYIGFVNGKRTTPMDKRIEEIRDERNGGGDFFVYLRPGYALSNPPQHCFGAVNKTEIKRTMAQVYRCQCDECKELQAA
jgi:hypothetical protein